MMRYLVELARGGEFHTHSGFVPHDGIIGADEGVVDWAERARPGYYDQHQDEALDPERTVLDERDGGCMFPGCDAPATACEGHHVVPWMLGGLTCLDNGVLLCPFHHRMVEPDPCRRPEHNWEITLDDAGNPWFTPPRQVDLQRRPRQHHRYRLRGRTLPISDPPEPPVGTDAPPGGRANKRLSIDDQIDLLQPSPNWV